MLQDRGSRMWLQAIKEISIISRPAVSLNQPPTRWLNRGLFLPEVKQSMCESDHRPPSANFKNAWSCTSAPPYAFTAWSLSTCCLRFHSFVNKDCHSGTRRLKDYPEGSKLPRNVKNKLPNKTASYFRKLWSSALPYYSSHCYWDWNELPAVQHKYSRPSVVRTVWAERWSRLPVNPDHRGEFRGIANVKKNHHTVPK
jgi:hypothetical protein